jgi:glycosyltransferase involved in cell wall biosynthesis
MTMLTDKYDFSLVIACYNEEPLLEESVKEVVQVLDSTCWTYEVIFVDDCSQDSTREIIDRLIKKYKNNNFRKLFHEKNTGRGRTVTDGIRLAQSDIVGYIDIDLEVPARYVPSMITALKNGADLATAHRVYKIHWRLFHRFVLSTGYKWLTRSLLGVNLKDTETGFKFFNRDRILPILGQVEDEHWFWDTEVMVRSLLQGYRIVEIPCLFIKRYDKRSSVNIFQDSFDYFVKLWRFRRVIRQMRKVTSQSQSTAEGRPVLPMSK